MVNDQFSKFTLRVNIDAPVEMVYKAWATPAGLESWFLRKAEFENSEGNVRDKDSLIESGDRYEWYWYGYPDSVVERGEIIEANGKNRFGFTFSLGCPVNVTIYIDQDETVVELVESKLPTDKNSVLKHYVGDSRGWIFYLTNLKSVLEGGLDLRNKRVELQDVITA